MITFDKRKTYMGYPVVNSYYESRDVEPYGKIRLLVREIEINGEIKRTMPFTSQAVAFYKYQDINDLTKHNTWLYQYIKEVYPDCTPHHDVDGYQVVPTLIHRAFPHFGTVGLAKYERQ